MDVYCKLRGLGPNLTRKFYQSSALIRPGPTHNSEALVSYDVSPIKTVKYASVRKDNNDRPKRLRMVCHTFFIAKSIYFVVFSNTGLGVYLIDLSNLSN